MTADNNISHSFELFTGAGGLALGVAEAGFRHLGVVEWNHEACSSLRSNASRIPLMKNWPVFEGDVRSYDFQQHIGAIDLLAAGAPCQPFSLGGKHRGHADDRNMFPQVFRAVREALPKAILIENVKGLLRSSFKPYFDYIRSAISFPEVVADEGEDWTSHADRLARVAKGNRFSGVRYTVTPQLVNAADYGVPQRRERVFLVAFREDVRSAWEEMTPTNSAESLFFAQWVDGSYWRDHGLKMPKVPANLEEKAKKMRSAPEPVLPRWITVRDALRGLPEPRNYVEDQKFANHVGNPGARTYPGHTGSPLDLPAKTLKAGDHGVPGGENILRYDDGSVRYFTVREAARLQTFPDEYVFSGAWSEGFRQLGNAVPVELAFAFAERIRAVLTESVEEPATRTRVA